MDGHLVLTRELAQKNHYPAIDILQSNSRLAQELLSKEQLERVGKARDLLAVYHQNRDLINIGAYQMGSNPGVDASVRAYEPLMDYLKQPAHETPKEQAIWENLGHVLAQAYPSQKEGVSESRSVSQTTTTE